MGFIVEAQHHVCQVNGETVKLGIPGAAQRMEASAKVMIPLQRVGTPEDAAGAMLMLASPYSSYISAQVPLHCVVSPRSQRPQTSSLVPYNCVSCMACCGCMKSIASQSSRQSESQCTQVGSVRNNRSAAWFWKSTNKSLMQSRMQIECCLKSLVLLCI